MPNRDRPRRDGHGDLDAWLHDRIEPLPPPPGTVEAIRRRARRRKYRRLAVSAGAAVAIIAAAVTVPQVVQLPIERGKQEAGSSPVTHSAASSTTRINGLQTTTTAPAATPSGNSVPQSFQPSSVTAVSETTVFTIGQAGIPGQCATQYCTSIARTKDAGQTWIGLPAPVTGPPDGATGVGQIRFLEGVNGWAFGPELWATHDGGLTWTSIKTHGQRVIDVETVGDRAFAIEATCTGAGADFAAQCTSFTLYSTPATVNRWTKVGAATSNLRPPGSAGSSGAAALVLTGARGYLLAPDGKLYAGPPTGAAWHPAGTIPCATGQAQLNGEPAGALLGAVTAQNLLLACAQPQSGTTPAKMVYASPDGGLTWKPSPVQGTA